MYFFACSELTQIIADVIYDPTLPRTEDHPCPNCGHREAVFFQSQSTRLDVSRCSPLLLSLSLLLLLLLLSLLLLSLLLIIIISIIIIIIIIIIVIIIIIIIIIIVIITFIIVLFLTQVMVTAGSELP